MDFCYKSVIHTTIISDLCFSFLAIITKLG